MDIVCGQSINVIVLLFTLQRLHSAESPMIVVGSAMLKGSNGAALLTKLQQLADKLHNGSAHS